MRVSDFDYELPPERIAQEPPASRESARLLVAGPDRASDRHVRISDLPDFLREGDLLVVNDTRVRPARLYAERETGRRFELLLLEPLASSESQLWKSLVRPAAKAREGEVLRVGELQVRMVERARDEAGELLPEWIVELVDVADSDLDGLLERVGHVPLPPYIRRAAGESSPEDKERYQTVYARESGAVAAPTAGLHFTDELFARLEEAGVSRTAVTLHVGAGTFKPVSVEDTADHRMHSEEYELSRETADAIAACRERGGRVVAIGTTSMRTLETCAAGNGLVEPGRGSTDIFITPGYRFGVVDLLLTNFHLPKSTLLMLVSAFSGRERILELYADAVEREYRFFSYGDAMLLTRSDRG